MTINATAFKQYPVHVIGAVKPGGPAIVIDETGLSYTVEIESLRMLPPEDAEPCEALENWQAAMNDVDRLCELDGPIGGLLAAQEHENTCARIYFHEYYEGEL